MPINTILFNETASFYTLKEGVELSTTKLKGIMKQASAKKFGNYYCKIVVEQSIPGLAGVTYSFVAFKTKNPPYAINKNVVQNLESKWMEIKFAYLLIVRCNNYVAICKKNVTIPSTLRKHLLTIDYQTFTNFLVTENTTFQKFGLLNLDMSSSAMRYKHLEANDLKESFSSTGAGNYELSSCKLTNMHETLSLTMNLSRMHQTGERLGIEAICRWVSGMVHRLETYEPGYTYLTRFATPVSYEDKYENLRPINILFVIHRIEKWFNENASYAILALGAIERKISFEQFLSYLSTSFAVDENNGAYQIVLPNAKNKRIGSLVMQKNSIEFQWEYPSFNVFFVDDDDKRTDFSHVINEIHAIIVYFQDTTLRYADRKLFENSNLLQSIPSFLSIFTGKDGLNRTKSEKGEVNATSTAFENDTIFHFIENCCMESYLILDDLGTEWGDYIEINGEMVTLYVAKSDYTKRFSASAFQEAVAQALKNIGSFNPPNRLLDSKQETWANMYKNNTQIPRIRHGANAKLAVEAWKRAIASPRYRKRIVIVTDCISLNLLRAKMQKLQMGEDFAEKKEAIPMLWLISSFISTCLENGVEPEIYCKE